MAPSVNLIPHARLTAQHRRRRIHAWIATVGVMFGVVSAGIAWSLLSMVDSGSLERLELAELQGRIGQLDEERTQKRAQLTDANARLRATLVVTLEPDWSLLMALIAESLKDDAVLESFRLLPVEGEEGGAAERPDYVLMISGAAKSQAGVSSFVLSLEELGLFDNVTLKGSSRRSEDAGGVVAFQLLCEFTASKEPAK